jgi:hypothetical protein
MTSLPKYPVVPASDPFPHTYPAGEISPAAASNRDLDAEVLRIDQLRANGDLGEISPRSAGRKFHRTNTNDLMAKTFPAIKWVVPGYLSEGFLVLAGRQKLGKTWLAIDMALAVATGGAAIGSIMCEQGDVLYIDLENGPRRIQSRIATLYPDERNRPDLSRLDWATDAPQLGAGFIAELERWRSSVSVPTLVIIDVLQRIKPAGSMARNAYENDYSIFAELQHWSTENRVAVLGLHHTKKGGADDPLEALSGSNGLSACADTTLVLDSDQNGKTLYVRGRDVEEKETALVFTAGFWSILGEAADVRRSGERNKIIAALSDHGEPMTPAEIAAATGMAGNNVRQLLLKMAKADEVYKAGKSRYWIEPLTPHNSDHNDNAEQEVSVNQGSIREPVTATDNAPDNAADTSKRHKCRQCGERGETIGVVRGWKSTHLDPVRLHRECVDAWAVEYDERNPQESEA